MTFFGWSSRRYAHPADMLRPKANARPKFTSRVAAWLEKPDFDPWEKWTTEDTQKVSETQASLVRGLFHLCLDDPQTGFLHPPAQGFGSSKSAKLLFFRRPT